MLSGLINLKMNSTFRIELLGKENYDSWKIQAKALLVENDLWEYVSGTIPRPTHATENVAHITAWDKADQKAMSKLILAISPSEVKQVRSCATSRELWQKLEGIYQSKGPAKKAHLFKKLTLLKMRETDNIREHINTFVETVEKLQEMDVIFDPEQLSIMLLYSLPDKFEIFRCAIETRDKLPDLDTLKIKILEESEAHEETNGYKENAMIASGRYRKNSKKPDLKYEKKGSLKANFEFKCFRCHKKGHKAVDCKKKLPEKAKKAEEKEEVSLLVTETVNVSNSAFQVEEVERTTKWCLDSGCTSHMCNDQRKFQELKETEHRSVNLASHASTRIEGEGTVKLIASGGANNTTVSLEALNVPDLRTNLISVSKIVSKGYQVIFDRNSASIVDNEGKVKLTAERRNGLYYINEQDQFAAKAEVDIKMSNIMKWHLRLGHLNEGSLRELTRKEGAIGIQIANDERLQSCEICLKGKLTQIQRIHQNH